MWKIICYCDYEALGNAKAGYPTLESLSCSYLVSPRSSACFKCLLLCFELFDNLLIEALRMMWYLVLLGWVSHVLARDRGKASGTTMLRYVAVDTTAASGTRYSRVGCESRHSSDDKLTIVSES